jgi:WD40 repeat protein
MRLRTVILGILIILIFAGCRLKTPASATPTVTLFVTSTQSTARALDERKDPIASPEDPGMTGLLQTLFPEPTSAAGLGVRSTPTPEALRSPTVEDLIEKPQRETDSLTITPWPSRTPTHTAPPYIISASEVARDSDPLPMPDTPILPNNVAKITELARWGKGSIRSLAYSPDGEQAAVATSQGIYLYETVSYELERFVPMDLDSGSLAFSPSLRYLAWEDQEGHVILIDVDLVQVFRQLWVSQNGVQAIAFSPDEKLLFISDYSEHLTVFNFPDLSVAYIREHGAWAFDFSADGRKVAVDDWGVRVWDIEDNDDGVVFYPTISDYDSFALSPDGNYLAIGPWELAIEIWSIPEQTLVREILLDAENGLKPGNALPAPPPRSGPGKYIVTGVAFSPDGRTLASRDGFGFLRQHRVKDGALLSAVSKAESYVKYSPDGSVLVSWDYTAQFWSARSGESIYVLGNHVGYISDLVFSRDGKSLAAGSRDTKVWWRRVKDGALIRTFKGHSEDIFSVDFAPDGSFIASGAFDNTIRLWAVTGGENQVFRNPDPWEVAVIEVGVSHDSQQVAFITGDMYDVFVVSVENGTWRNPGSGTALDFSPVEALLAIGGFQVITLRQVDDLATIRILEPEDHDLFKIAFSPDGQYLAGGTENLTIWRVSDGITIAVRKDKNYYINKLAFSPDSKLLAVLHNYQLDIYRAGDLELLRTIPLRSIGHHSGLAFSPDGRLLALGLADGTIRMWGLAP